MRLVRRVKRKVCRRGILPPTEFWGLIGAEGFTSDSAFSAPIGLGRQRRVSLLSALIIGRRELRLRRLLKRIENPRHDGQLVQELRHTGVCRKKPRKGLGNLFQEAARLWLQEARAAYRTRGPGGSGPSLRCRSRSSCRSFTSSAMRCASLYSLI